MPSITDTAQLSPSASLYAMSDDEEGEYETIRETKTGRGVKLLFTKSKVYVHPTPSARDNLGGFIALIQQKGPVAEELPSSPSSSKSIGGSSLLLAWVPESSLGDAYETYVKVDLSDSSAPPKQSYLVPPPQTTLRSTDIGTYAFAIPVSEIYSLLVRPPSIGWWYGSLIINTRVGDSFPALFFHDDECQSTILQRKKHMKERFDPFGNGGEMFWGGDEVLRWLKQYVNVERSGHDSSVYLVEPSDEDRLGFGSSKEQAAKDRKDSKGSSEGASSGTARRDAGMHPVTKALKEAQWNILEKFSQVTNLTRRTAQAVADNPKVPTQVRRLMRNPDVVTLQEEFDSARVYLARWAMGIADQSERERRQRIWTAKDVMELEESSVGDFEILDMEIGGLSLEERRRPVTMEKWKSWFDTAGRLQLTSDEVKDRIFHGGLNPDDNVRQEAWLFILGVYAWDSSADERDATMNSLREEYVRLKGAWWERMADGSGTETEREWWREQKLRIEKDVHRTDRDQPLFHGDDIPNPNPDSSFAGTNVHLEQCKDLLLTYNEYNKDLGYVQGMSDLLAPIYAVMQDDAVAFWAFVGFMERMERNFLRDQSGMRLQLTTLDHLVQFMDPKLYTHLQQADSTNFFFFFRMLIVWFKREFEWNDVLRLWEGLWTDYLSSNFHLFIALAILEKHRMPIMEHLQHFDEVLKYINELSGHIELEATLIRAEALFRRFQRSMEAIDKRSNFPAPGLRLRRPPQDVVRTQSSSGTTEESHATQSAKNAASKTALASGTNAQSHSTQAGRTSGLQSTTEVKADDSEAEETPAAVSPLLRDLLSRKVPKLEKKEIRAHGGGIN